MRPALGGQKQRGVLLELCALPQRVALRHPRPPDDYGGHGPRGENLYLACTALGLGTCGIGAYDQKLCDKTFQLDGEEEFTLYTQSVGTVKDEDEGKEKAFYSFVEEQ